MRNGLAGPTPGGEGGESGRIMKLTTPPYLMQRSRLVELNLNSPTRLYSVVLSYIIISIGVANFYVVAWQ